MPRTKRTKSNTDIYHIMSRSIEKKLLFEEEGDYLKYLTLLSEAKQKFNLKIYAYCLMSNHIHLIMKIPFENISKMMKWLNSSYALFFNTKYERLGYVFADRFRSEAIVTSDYMWECIRYIHQNPTKAGICQSIYEYKFSSIHSYKKIESNYLNLVDVSAVLKKYGKEDFLSLNEMENHKLCMDYLNNHYTDIELQKILFSLVKVKNVKEYDKLDAGTKIYGALKLIDMYVPLRQISRVTGIYYSKLQKMRLGVEGKVVNLTYININTNNSSAKNKKSKTQSEDKVGSEK